MMLEVVVYKVDYARGGLLRLIMKFVICKMSISDQGGKLVDRNLMGFDSGNEARVLNNAR